MVKAGSPSNGRVGLVFLGVLIAGMLAFWFGILEPIHSHASWQRRVRADLTTLAHRRSAGVTKGQWDFAVGWTINLHCNCGKSNSAWRDRLDLG